MPKTLYHTHALGVGFDPIRVSGPRLKPEARLLLACAHANLSSEQARAIEDAVAHGVDWWVVLGLSQAHGISHFVSRHLRQLFRGASRGSRQDSLLPDAVQDLMQREAWQRAVYAHILLDYQLRLAREFDDRGISVLWLKGLALSEKLYGCPEARNSCDLDPLVEPGQVSRAEECLSRCGFQQLQSPTQDLHTMGSHHSRWRAEAQGALVELHWRLAGPSRCVPDVAGMMRRSRTTQFGGRSIRVLSPEDELLTLCLHGHHHNFACLRYLMDVVEYVQRFHRALDWRQFAALASAHRCLGRASAAFALGRLTLGLPSVVAWQPWQPRLSPLQRWVVDGLGADALVEVGGDERDGRRVALGLLMDRWADVIGLLGPHLFPSSSYLRACYPGRWARLPGVGRAYHLAQLARRFACLVFDRRGMTPPLSSRSKAREDIRF